MALFRNYYQCASCGREGVDEWSATPMMDASTLSAQPWDHMEPKVQKHTQRPPPVISDGSNPILPIKRGRLGSTNPHIRLDILNGF